MLRGLYTAAAGMQNELIRNETIARNLAAINAAGYKKELVVSRAFPEMLLARINDQVVRTPAGNIDMRPRIGVLGTGVAADELYTVHTQGKLYETGNPLDVAIVGEGFFVVQTPAGERYTRDGAFTLDADSILTTLEGFPVLGANGEKIKLTGAVITIDEQGRVASDGQAAGQLRLVGVANPDRLGREGAKWFVATPASGTPAPAAVSLRQGYGEMSNVEPVLEMTEMITVMRTYEANQKMLQAQDQTLDKAVNEIARI